jgi:hypothetical protein
MLPRQPLLEAQQVARAHGMNVVERLADDGTPRFALYRGPVRYRVRLGSFATTGELLGAIERAATAIKRRRRPRPTSGHHPRISQ